MLLLLEAVVLVVGHLAPGLQLRVGQDVAEILLVGGHGDDDGLVAVGQHGVDGADGAQVGDGGVDGGHGAVGAGAALIIIDSTLGLLSVVIILLVGVAGH